MIVGIDFGTCFSSAAIMSGLIPVTNYASDTNEGIPSLFMFSKETGKELYGIDCTKREAVENEDDVVRYMKRLVRADPDSLGTTIVSGGQEYTVAQVIEKFLTYLVAKVRKGAMDSGEFQDDRIEALAVTAPVGIAKGQMMASDYNKLLQEMMGRITGLDADRISVVLEPVAAAISYLYSADIRKHYDGKQTVLVFDLGGGTLDVTVVEHDPAAMTYEIKAKEGDLELGGNDWDACLAKLVMEKAGKDSFSSKLDEASFRREVTKLKENLTMSDKAGMMFDDGDEDYVVKVTREEFDGCTEELLERAVEVVRRTLDSCDSDVDRIVLVGGGSNMPQIRERLAEEFCPLRREGFVEVFEPSKAIAKGAAVYAKLAASANGSQEGPKVLDIATLSYGFESRKDGVEDMIYNMIYKGASFGETGRISVRSESSFIALKDDQTRVSFRVYESEAPEGEGPWMPFGNGETYNGLEVTVQVPPEYLGKATSFAMWPEMALDSNGIVDITVRDRAGNKLAYGTTAKRCD